MLTRMPCEFQSHGDFEYTRRSHVGEMYLQCASGFGPEKLLRDGLHSLSFRAHDPAFYLEIWVSEQNHSMSLASCKLWLASAVPSGV